MRNITDTDREAARARIAAQDAAQDAHRFAWLPALAVCNACDVETVHDSCAVGYCAGCCTVH